MLATYKLGSTAALFHADMREALRVLPACCIDAVVTDPPYHLTSIVKRFGAENAAPAQFGSDGRFARASVGFMGKQWDGGDIAFRPETWREVFRVLKPGGHLVAMGGTRTFARMSVAIEDSGFEIRDTLMWLYGTGFPKSYNIGDGWGTALKPAVEPIVLARKPLSEATVRENVQRWGTGAINIDGCRVSIDDEDRATYERNCTGDRGFADSRVRNMKFSMGCGKASNIGRWPANVIHDDSPEVVEAFPDSKSCNSRSSARFFYSAKANRADRVGSKHPTVKPVSLMRWLVRLISPPGGIVLDPFAGTGTTGAAAILEGRRALMIEREPEYVRDIARRFLRLFVDYPQA